MLTFKHELCFPKTFWYVTNMHNFNFQLLDPLPHPPTWGWVDGGGGF